MNFLRAPTPFWQPKGVAVIRIILGLLVIYHGQEIFQRELMNEYLSWDNFNGPYGKYLLYFGKAVELVAGISLFLGLYTRVGAILLICSLTYITFFVGSGRFWYEDQHPFMFVLIGAIYVFTGPGAWSLDQSLLASKRNQK